MKPHYSIGLASIFCALLASCYPINEGPGRNPKNQGQTQPGQPQPLTPEQQKIKDADDLKKKEASKKQAELRKQEELNNGNVGGTTGGSGSSAGNLPPSVKEKADYEFANKVPGKDGFVFSPYNNKVVDVRDIPKGTLVRDPTFQPSEKKYFRVP